MKISGRAWVFGDDIDTDQIFPGAYLTLTDVEEMGKHAMEGVPGREDFAKKVAKGDIIVAGKNFGCGSSREQAPLALKAKGIQAVIAKSFARIFYRNAINLGLLVLEADTDEIEDGDELELDMENSEIIILNREKSIKFKPLPEFMQKIIQEGGVIEYIKKRGDI